MKLLNLLFLSLSLLILACGGEQKDKNENGEVVDPSKVKTSGIKRTYHQSTGKLKLVVNVVDGKREGLEKAYYADGTIDCETEYLHNKKHGTEKKYYGSGKLYRIRQYEDGKRTGTEKRFWESGTQMAEVNYKMNFVGTKIKEFSSSGKLKTDYPKLLLSKRKVGGNYEITVKYDGKIKKFECYAGKLIEDEFYNHKLRQIVHTEKYEAKVKVPASMKGQEVTICAKTITKTRTPYITTAKIKL